MFKLLQALFVAGSLITTSAFAADLPQPQGRVILTVSGNIENTNAPGEARYDRAMLEQLESRVTETTTPWFEGKKSFEGPLGRALLDQVGAKGEVLKVQALNDYVADVPVKDFYDYDVILAMKLDGKKMRIRDKGPLFIIYPFDEHEELRNELYNNRSVWQIKAIRVE